MAQIVILAPKGEDVEAGKQALVDAGHEVEVVEADPVHLLHLALGMMEDDEGGEEVSPEELPADEVSQEEVPPEDAPEEPKNEDITFRGDVALLEDTDFARLAVVVATSIKRPWLAAPKADHGYVALSEGLGAKPAQNGTISISVGVDSGQGVNAAVVTARVMPGKKSVLYLDPTTAARIL